MSQETATISPKLIKWAKKNSGTLREAMTAMDELRNGDSSKMVKVPSGFVYAAMRTLRRDVPVMAQWDFAFNNVSTAVVGGAALGALVGKVDPESDIDICAVPNGSPGIPEKISTEEAVMRTTKHLEWWLSEDNKGTSRVEGVNVDTINWWKTEFATTAALTWYPGDIRDAYERGCECVRCGTVTLRCITCQAIENKRPFDISVLHKENETIQDIPKWFDVPLCGVVLTPGNAWMTPGAVWCLANQKIYLDPATWNHASFERYGRYLGRTGFSLCYLGENGNLEEITLDRDMFQADALGPAYRIPYSNELAPEETPEETSQLSEELTKKKYSKWNYQRRDETYESIALNLDFDGEDPEVPKIVWKRDGRWGFHYKDVEIYHEMYTTLPMPPSMRAEYFGLFEAISGTCPVWPTQPVDWQHQTRLFTNIQDILN